MSAVRRLIPFNAGVLWPGSSWCPAPNRIFPPSDLQDLLQVYAHLLGLAFETHRFYPPERVRLRPMPAE